MMSVGQPYQDELAQDFAGTNQDFVSNTPVAVAYLFTNNLTPTPQTVFADIVEPTFTGYVSKTSGNGPVVASIDPLTGEYLCVIPMPAGGFRWVCTVTPGAPQIIYGAFIKGNITANTIRCYKFDQPITIAVVGDQIDIGPQLLRFLQNAIS